MQQTSYAFLDVDGTIYNGDSPVDFIRYVVEKGRADKKLLDSLNTIAIAYRSDKIPYSDAVRDVMNLLAHFMAGNTHESMQQLTHQWIQEYASHIHTFTKPLIDLFHSKNIMCYLVSATSSPIIQGISGVVGADGYIATIHESVNGTYTDKIVRLLNDQEKSQAIIELLDTSGQALFGIGDTTGDIHMLKLTTHSLVINPRQDEMKKIIAHEGWLTVNPDTILDVVAELL